MGRATFRAEVNLPHRGAYVIDVDTGTDPLVWLSTRGSGVDATWTTIVLDREQALDLVRDLMAGHDTLFLTEPCSAPPVHPNPAARTQDTRGNVSGKPDWMGDDE